MLLRGGHECLIEKSWCENVTLGLLGMFEPMNRALHLRLNILARHRTRLMLGCHAARMRFLDHADQLLPLGALNFLSIHQVAECVKDRRGLELAG